MKGGFNLLFVSAAALFISTRYFDYAAGFAWFMWSFNVAFELSHRCFFRNPVMESLFKAIEDRDLDKSVRIPSTPVAIIEAKDYSFKALEYLSQSWTQPVIVRGMFAESTAVKNWRDPNYLISKTFGNSSVSVIHNGTIVKHYDMVCGKDEAEGTFSDYKPFDETLHRITAGSTETIVFPPASRSKRIRDKVVEQRWNDMVKDDLDLVRIGDAFADNARSTVLTQMFLGGGVTPSEINPVIGTGWHADVCNNFVVQISGIKKWIMVDPKYSKYMRPTMRTGKTAIVGAHLSIEVETMPHFPHHVFELYPGDFLYNPEWYWHSIQNHPADTGPYGPFAFGLISRQCHISRNFKQSFIFTSLVVINHAKAFLFDVEARMRIAGLIFGESLMQPEKGVNVAAQNEARGGYT